MSELVSANVSRDNATTFPTGPGTVFGGRYRLGTRVGSDTAAAAEFWLAHDIVLRRDVGMTVLRKLRPEAGALGGDADPTGAARAGEMIVRSLRSSAFEHNGCARLLDVIAPGTAGLPDDVLGAAITEWVPGRSLAETVADGLIKPLAAARAVAPLAAAIEEAHRHGLVLGCDHPQRVRISPEGHARLSFALPRPDVTPTDDVRGLGAVLYTLLASCWPLSGADAAGAGLATAGRTVDGTPLVPSLQRPGVPVELDALAAGTLGPAGVAGQVRTAAAVRRLLTEVVEEDDRIALFPPAHDGVPSTPGDIWQDNRGAPASSPERRRKLAIGLSALAMSALVALGYVGVQISAVFAEGGPVVVVAGEPAGSNTSPGGTPGGVVAAARVNVYDNTGDTDNAGRVARVIDGDTDSSWSTFTYRQQFPALKPGVGIMVSFATAVPLSSVVITSPSAGTVIEIRSAPAASPPFAQTVPITQTVLTDGVTQVSLTGGQPVSHVLLWITELGGRGDAHRTEISEIEFRRAGT